jgi:hypothetical protein
VSNAEQPRVRGITAGGNRFDTTEIVDRAAREFARAARYYKLAQAQTIEFSRGPVALVFASDLHLGSTGTDMRRALAEAKIICATPGMWLVLAGDLLDNFVAQKLMHARHNSRVAIEEEWELVRHYLEIVAPRLLVSVAGNHERFTYILSGIDFFKQILERVAPKAIYDSDDVLFTLRVGKAHFPIRVRHDWQGKSFWNITHQIERAAKVEQNFVCGVGGHTHASGVARQFNLAGRTAMAVLCGSYKAFDLYARQRGFPRANESTAVTVLFYESGAMVGINSLNEAREIIARYRSR